jgi:hypothetical protein
MEELPGIEPQGEPSATERLLVSPAGILLALSVTAAGALLLGWLF